MCVFLKFCCKLEAYYHQYRKLCHQNKVKVKPSLSPKHLEKAVRALITSSLHYCNSLCAWQGQSTPNRVELIQNSVACLLDFIDCFLRF